MKVTLSRDVIDSIPRALRACDGNKREAARRLGINISTLYKHLPKSPIGDTPSEPETVEQLVNRLVAERLASVPIVEAVAREPTIYMPLGKSRVVPITTQYERVAFVSDMHHPFMDQTAFDVVYKVLLDYRPQLIILGGDQFDFFSISDHEREPGRATSIQEEFDVAQPTWKRIDALRSHGLKTVIWLDGNHEARLQRLTTKNPGLFRAKCVHLPFAAELPKSWMYYPPQTRLRLGGIYPLHGDLQMRGNNNAKPAAAMLGKLRCSCLFGHFHKFDMAPPQVFPDDRKLYAYANGHLSDIDEARYITFPDWQQGISLLDYDWSTDNFNVTQIELKRSQAAFYGSKVYRVDS